MSFLLLIWYGLGLLFSPLVYAMWFYHFQTKYPEVAKYDYSSDRLLAIRAAFISILCGPLGILLLCFLERKCLGLKWR